MRHIREVGGGRWEEEGDIIDRKGDYVTTRGRVV